MLQLVKTPTSTTFMDLVSKCDRDMVLCAPFIKTSTVKEILSKKKTNAALTVITSSVIANFAQQSSDLSAIRLLLENNISVFNYQYLHAKIYLFDNLKALITSANLTPSGMNKNYEYGVLIDNNDELMDQIETDFLCLLEDRKKAGKFDLDTIEHLEKTLKTIEKVKYVIKEDEEDNILTIDKDTLMTHMATWHKDIFDVVCKLDGVYFTLKDVYFYIGYLSKLHPSNKHIEAKIRQALQQLRDLGLIKFDKPGQYKKLYCLSK